MSLTLVTEPTIEPITLEQLKAQLRLDVDNDDELLRDLIEVARSWVEGQTHRALASQTYDYAIDWEWPMKYGYTRIDLPLNPISSVTSITYVDNNGASQTLAANQYIVSARNHSSYIAPAYGVSWPDVRCIPSAITVRFVAGSDTNIPVSLKHAVKMLAAHLYENREAVAPKEMMAIPFGIEALVSPYRKAGIA